MSKADGKWPLSGIIHTIVGSMKEWATSRSKRRAHLRSVMTIVETSKKPRQEDWQIKFSAMDVDIIKDSGNNPIAISIIINKFLIKRILVDDGSVVEVLMYEEFKRMGLDENLLRSTSLIYEFAN